MLARPGLTIVPFLFAFSVALGACTDDLGAGPDDETGAADSEDFVDADFLVRESVRQLQVTQADPDTPLRVIDSAGLELAIGVTDYQGSLIFRELPPGTGYSVEQTGPGPRQAARDLLVMSVADSYPDPSFYASQNIQPGYNYITTRDGTTLSAYVTLPGPIEDGPYPTIVNYSGYEPSRPGRALSEQFSVGDLDLDSLCPLFPVICDAPNHPSGVLGGFLGFATVGVNMRGTGCSGGAYDFFEELQVLDGYDLIETIAGQDWVLGNKVAMTGLSYPGISQMWVAQTQPPSLAAITPLSIFAHTADSVLRPGGITNDGFAINWAENVLDNAVPYGQGWEQGLVAEGDTICADNQLLHSQLVDVTVKIDDNPYYTPEVYDPLTPLTFVDDIDVPVFVTGAWQDEQTGGDFPSLFNAFSSAPVVKFTMFNGAHADGYVPEHLIYWGAFLDFYLREEIPMIPPALRNLGPGLFAALLGEPIQFPPDPYTMYESYAEALAAFEGEAPITIKFEMGNSEAYGLGIPQSAWELSAKAWPPEDLAPERWYLQPSGALAPTPPPPSGGASSYHIDSLDARTSTLPSGDVNAQLPPWNWKQDQPDTAAVFISEPLSQALVMVGPASADLWIRSSVGEADIEVNISEVRPDGQEMYIQSGWLRASQRALDGQASTALEPIHTHLEADLLPVPADEWVEARVKIFPFAHAFRVGSRIRISVDTPGSSRAEWLFILHDSQTDSARVEVAHSDLAPSSVLLPILPGQAIPTELPPCPSLRAQPCRDFVEFNNTVAN